MRFQPPNLIIKIFYISSSTHLFQLFYKLILTVQIVCNIADREKK